MDQRHEKTDVLKRYGLAVLLAGLALLVRGVLPVLEGTTIYQLPLAAVVVSAWLGGRGPGYLAAAECVVVIVYWFLPPEYGFTVDEKYVVGLAIFSALCVLLVEFSAARGRAEEALRGSEARFRTFVDHATDAFFLHDDDALTILDANRQACQSLGYSRAELIGMHPASFDAALDPSSIEVMADRVKAGETVTFETRHRRRDGTVFPVEVRVRRFDQGENRFRLSLARDITQRKVAEETVRQKDAALETARTELASVSRLTTLGELTASIAHEVNQPLGAMVANAGACVRWLAAEPPRIDKVQQTLESISADGRRASDVIGRIRALAKRQAPRRDPLDVNQNVVDTLALAEHELRSKGIVLKTRLDPALPRVAGDGVQLQQVLLNLIMNAIDAMSAVHDRPRELTIVSEGQRASDVTVEVRDSGAGLDSAAIERVFEAFYSTKPDGIGIGLSISRSIIEAHGGTISASPNAPYGAVFRVSLPAADAVRA